MDAGRWLQVAINSQPRLSGILDTINSTLAYGSKTLLPTEIYDRRSMGVINQLVVEEKFSSYAESRDYRALGICSLLGDVVLRKILNVDQNSQKKFCQTDGLDRSHSSAHCRDNAVKLGLYGCHESTLAAVLTSLGTLKLESWPHFSSHLALKLFRKAEAVSAAWTEEEISSPGRSAQHVRKMDGLLQSPLPSRAMNTGSIVGKLPSIGRRKIDSLHPSVRSELDGYYVRILYNGQPVTVPGCKALGNHLDDDESFCTLEAFKSIVDKFTPLHWKRDCWKNLKEPVFPVKPEPAGY